VAESERLRLFCALRLPDAVIEKLREWQASELHGGRLVPGGHGGRLVPGGHGGRLVPGGHGGRLVPAENLHVTLAFLGSRPAGEVASIARALAESVAGVGSPRLRARAYRETRSVGMVVLDDEDGRASMLAKRLHERLSLLGLYTPEERPWLPHVTVIRYRVQPRLRPALPALGDVAPSDAAVFISRLRSDGVQYEAVETVPLGG
jgi:RNA 2',3'-cyclic 3'-phosphodiesterase